MKDPRPVDEIKQEAAELAQASAEENGEPYIAWQCKQDEKRFLVRRAEYKTPNNRFDWRPIGVARPTTDESD